MQMDTAINVVRSVLCINIVLDAKSTIPTTVTIIVPSATTFCYYTEHCDSADTHTITMGIATTVE